MKNKYLLELIYYILIIMTIFVLNYLAQRFIDISIMPVFLLIIGVTMIGMLFKKFGIRLIAIWKIIPMISILVYLFFVILLYLTEFNFLHWENEPWFNIIATTSLVLYIVTFIPLLTYLSFSKTSMPQ